MAIWATKMALAVTAFLPLGSYAVDLYTDFPSKRVLVESLQNAARSLRSKKLLSTGKKHGAFYQPLPVWIRPLKAWIEQSSMGGPNALVRK